MLAILCSYGAAAEIVQARSAYRVTDPADFLQDVAGILVAAAVWSVIQKTAVAQRFAGPVLLARDVVPTPVD